MAILTAIWNMNGGCGKSPTAHHIAVSLSSLKKKTLLVEGDSMAPLFIKERSSEVIQKFIDGSPLKEISIETKIPFLFRIPASSKEISLLNVITRAHPRYN